MVTRSKALIYLSRSAGRGFESHWRHIFFILNVSLPFRSQQLSGAIANEIKHDRFTCSHSCFRPQIRLIIQCLVYLKPQYSFNMNDKFLSSVIIHRSIRNDIFSFSCTSDLTKFIFTYSKNMIICLSWTQSGKQYKSNYSLAKHLILRASKPDICNNKKIAHTFVLSRPIKNTWYFDIPVYLLHGSSNVYMVKAR